MIVGFVIPDPPKKCPDCEGRMIREKSVMLCTKDRTHGVQLTTEDVELDPNHTFIAGTTGTGKSKTMRRLIEECEDTILIIDAKRIRDYADLDADIPLYIEQQMEPIVIKDSIETTERFSVRKEFATLLEVIVEAETWVDMLGTIERELEKARGYIRSNLNILKYFIERLVKEYNKFEWSSTLELHKGINVMNISGLKAQLQQLVVGSVIRFIQENLTNITVVIDEAHRFVPQGMTSGCSRDVIAFVREGRASSNWLWAADQTVTGVTKDLLKQMQYWILGRQSEINEVERTVKQIPRRKSLGITNESIQTLGVGEFLVVCHEWAKRTYIWPLWIDEETAIKVALGEIDVKEIKKLEFKEVGDDEDLKWKKRYDELKIENEKLRKNVEKLIKEFKTSKKRIEKMEKASNSESKLLAKLRETMTELFGIKSLDTTVAEGETIEVPEGISVSVTQPIISVVKVVKRLELTENELLGKIAIIYASGELPKDKWFPPSIVNKVFENHAWVKARGTLTAALDQMAQWGYFEKKFTGNRPNYRIKILPEEAKEKGLLIKKEIIQ